MTLSPNKMLDKTLEWFATDFKDMGIGEDAVPRTGIDHYKGEALIARKYPELNTEEYLEYSTLIFDQLVEDGYLKKEMGKYSINFKGKVFSKKGGYEKADELSAKAENRKDSYEKQLLYGTWAVAAGAFALVLWDVYKTLCLHLD